MKSFLLNSLCFSFALTSLHAQADSINCKASLNSYPMGISDGRTPLSRSIPLEKYEVEEEHEEVRTEIRIPLDSADFSDYRVEVRQDRSSNEIQFILHDIKTGNSMDANASIDGESKSAVVSFGQPTADKKWKKVIKVDCRQ